MNSFTGAPVGDLQAPMNTKPEDQQLQSVSEWFRVLYFNCSDEEFDNFVKTRQVLDELDIGAYRLADCMVLQEVCRVVSTRAAYLAAAGIILDDYVLVLKGIYIAPNREKGKPLRIKRNWKNTSRMVL